MVRVIDDMLVLVSFSALGATTLQFALEFFRNRVRGSKNPVEIVGFLHQSHLSIKVIGQHIIDSSRKDIDLTSGKRKIGLSHKVSVRMVEESDPHHGRVLGDGIVHDVAVEIHHDIDSVVSLQKRTSPA